MNYTLLAHEPSWAVLQYSQVRFVRTELEQNSKVWLVCWLQSSDLVLDSDMVQLPSTIQAEVGCVITFEESCVTG